MRDIVTTPQQCFYNIRMSSVLRSLGYCQPDWSGGGVVPTRFTQYTSSVEGMMGKVATLEFAVFGDKDIYGRKIDFGFTPRLKIIDIWIRTTPIFLCVWIGTVTKKS